MSPVLRGHHLTHATIVIPGYPVESVFDTFETVIEVWSLSVSITFSKS